MAVTIRLMRFGKKAQPSYRIVVLDKRQKRDGAYIEKIGLYNPLTEPASIELNQERLSYWQKQGAIISEGMTKLLKRKELKAPTAPKEEKQTAKVAKKPAKKAAKKTA